jgi:hypothetical protein
MLVTICVAIGSAVLHVSQRGHGTQTDTSLLVTTLGGATAALVAYRVLISLPQPNAVVDQKLGAVLGVLAALGIAFGGFESLREERAHARRLEQRSRGRSGPMAQRARAR